MTKMSRMSTVPAMVCRIALIAATLVAAVPGAQAQEPSKEADAPGYPFKLTLGWYRNSDDANGLDVNLRHTSDLGNVWLGYFREPDQDASQWRAGWDRSFGSTARIQPSLQIASGGFVGASVGVETGEPWFVGAGLGRTNLRPYYNLNFDPNDSWQLAAGRRGEGGQLLMVQVIRDNRENPDQRHVHFVWRRPLDGGERLGVDVLWKKGLVEEEMIQRWGITVTYDWPRFFLRLAFDPKTNFTPFDTWRLSTGTRF